MNVTKCSNGHFYDGDKYAMCPHCGDKVSINDKKVSVAESGKSHSGFWGKRKPEPVTDNFKAVPDGTISKTFGVFDTEKVKVEPQSESESISYYKIMKDENNRDDNEKEGTDVGNSFQNKTAAEMEEDAVADTVNSELDDTNVKISLQDAVKKASAGNDGKTVGFFSANIGRDTKVTANSEPVVGWLVCVKGVYFGESFNISAGRNSVGRGESNKVNLSKDDTVSRSKHAWLIYEPKRREFYIQPGESSGLLYLNGDVVFESQKLKARDILEIGNGEYLFIPLCSEDFSWEEYINKE